MQFCDGKNLTVHPVCLISKTSLSCLLCSECNPFNGSLIMQNWVPFFQDGMLCIAIHASDIAAISIDDKVLCPIQQIVEQEICHGYLICRKKLSSIEHPGTASPFFRTSLMAVLFGVISVFTLTSSSGSFMSASGRTFTLSREQSLT